MYAYPKPLLKKVEIKIEKNKKKWRICKGSREAHQARVWMNKRVNLRSPIGISEVILSPLAVIPINFYFGKMKMEMKSKNVDFLTEEKGF